MSNPVLQFSWVGEALVDVAQPPKLVGGEFGFTEGPVWVPGIRSWIFSDIPRSQMWMWTSAEGLALYRQPSRKANGNTLDLHGALISCEHETSRVVRAIDGAVVPIAETFGGLRLNSPNDVIVDQTGSTLFTDPTYGLTAGFGKERPQELAFQGVYRSQRGELVLLDGDFDAPNGLCLSPVQDILYVNDSERKTIYRFTYDAGVASDRTVFARVASTSTAVPDGMKCDRFGNVWCTGAEGVRIYDSTGREIGVLRYDGDDVANFAFGGTNGNELLLTAGRTVVHATLSSALAIERTVP